MILSKQEINSQLTKYVGWEIENNEVAENFNCPDFAEAMSFVVKVELIAEKNNHHPNILIHSWNKDQISVSTHLANGITNNDLALISNIER